MGFLWDIIRYKLLKNVVLDFCGITVMAGVLQLLVFPLLSRKLSLEDFGSFLTLIAISNIMGSIFGGSINNIRLIRNQEYANSGYEGDFRIIMECGAVLTALGMLIGIFFFRNQVSPAEWLLLPLLSLLTMLRSYMTIEYRINLDYIKIMLHSFATCVGYLVGIPLFFYFNEWTLIFLVGEFCAFAYACSTTGLFNEPRTKTHLFKKTLKETIQLFFSNLVTNILSYLDRLMVNPILGPANVSIFFVASLVGKTMGTMLLPVAGVTLSFVSGAKKQHAPHLFIITIVGALACGVVAFVVSIPLSSIVIKFLYYNMLQDASAFFLVANLAVILATVGSLFQPVILRFCPIKWQMITQSVFLCVYIVFGVGLMLQYGLWGFCIGTIVAHLVRMVLLIAVGYFYIIRPRME